MRWQECAMSDPSEAPANKWPVNRLALDWLKKVRGPMNPQAAYVAQLAHWGLEEGKVEVPYPIAPLQPNPEDVAMLAAQLTMHGRREAHQAMRFLVSYPEMDREEQLSNLESGLRQAKTPEQAAWAVVDHLMELMVAHSE